MNGFTPGLDLRPLSRWMGGQGGQSLKVNNGLIKFPGVLLFASHDHQFVETTANRIMEIMPGGQLIDKITTYDEYLASDEMARKRQVYTMKEEDN